MVSDYRDIPGDLLTRPITFHRGVTTGAGNVGGTTIVDAALIGAVNQGIVNTLVILNPYTVLTREQSDCSAFDTVTGTITVSAAFSAQVAAGVPYALLAFPPMTAEVAAIQLQTDKLVGLEDAGTHVHANNLNWQNVFTLTTGLRHKVWAIWLDMVNLTQNMNMRMQYEIDGANPRTFWADTWTVALDDGVLINTPRGIANDFTLDLQSVVLEGAGRNIPYELIYELKE